MRIGIDVRYLSHGLVGGVHTYVSNFVPPLLDLAAARGHEVVLYADSKRPFELESVPSNTTVRLLTWRHPVSSIYHDLSLRWSMARDQLDLVHFPANYGFATAGARTVLTLHDAINILPFREIVRGHRKRVGTLAMMSYLHWCTTAAVRRADLVLTVSSHAAREIALHGRIDPQRIVPIPHAPTPDLRRITDVAELGAVRQRYGLPGSFVLADALKNPAVLVRAWQLLPAELRQGRKIVFFSRRPDPLPIIGEAVEAGTAQLLVGVPRTDLIALYSMAEAFVFPSWIEGFGLPILEAMTCGAPIIASDRGAIPEVLGDAGRLVDAEDAAGLARELGELLGNQQLARQLQARGFARATEFSWQATAERILHAYEQVATAEPAPAHSTRRPDKVYAR
jgi:glycosyltransferase involved in cell wall biosynthesis